MLVFNSQIPKASFAALSFSHSHSSNMSILAICPKMKEWFSGATKVAFRSKEVFCLWVLAAVGGSASRPSIKLIMKKIVFAVFTCTLALGLSLLLLFYSIGHI